MSAGLNTNIKVNIRRSNKLNTGGVTASSIYEEDFQNNTFPLFYNAYKPKYSFIAVPPEWLKDLALKAGLYAFAEELVHSISNVYGEKGKILTSMSENYHERRRQTLNKEQNTKMKGGEK